MSRVDHNIYHINNFYSLLTLLTLPLSEYSIKVSLHFANHCWLNGGSPQVNVFDCRLKREECVSSCGVFVVLFALYGVVDTTGRERGRRWRYRFGSAAEEAPYPAEDKHSTSFICDKTRDSIDVLGLFATIYLCIYTNRTNTSLNAIYPHHYKYAFINKCMQIGK